MNIYYEYRQLTRAVLRNTCASKPKLKLNKINNRKIERADRSEGSSAVLFYSSCFNTQTVQNLTAVTNHRSKPQLEHSQPSHVKLRVSLPSSWIKALTASPQALCETAPLTGVTGSLLHTEELSPVSADQNSWIKSFIFLPQKMWEMDIEIPRKRICKMTW